METLLWEILVWTAMAVLVIFLGARLWRRVQHEQALLEAGLDESFERQRDLDDHRVA